MRCGADLNGDNLADLSLQISDHCRVRVGVRVADLRNELLEKVRKCGSST